MSKKILIFVFALVALNEAKLFDSLDAFTSLNVDEVLSRVRRDVDVSNLTHEDEKAIEEKSTLTELIRKTAKKNLNVSLIAWQHVYDDTGKIVEVVSLELVLLSKAAVEDISIDVDFFDSRSNQHEVAAEFEDLAQLRDNEVFADFFVEATGDEKVDSKLFYWNPDSVYFKGSDHFVTFNRTKVATNEEVEEFLETIKKQKDDLILKPLIIRYDVDGNVKLSESTLATPSIVSYVVDAWTTSDKILLDSPKILADIVVEHERNLSNIPKLLAEKFNQVFDEYEWRVLVNPGELYIVKDVWIQLSLDGFAFYKDESRIFYVYGILKTTNYQK